MKTIIFAPATFNLSESARMLALARACAGKFKPVFISYGGKYRTMIEAAAYPLKDLEPKLTDAKIEHLVQIDRMEKRGDFFTAAELGARVKSELAVYEEIQPAAVVTGFCLSTFVSARVAKLPLVSVLAAAGLRPYYEAGLGTWPDAFDYWWLRWIPDRTLNWFMNHLTINSGMFTGPFNAAAKEFGVPGFRSFLDLVEGCHLLMSDVPEMTGLTDLPSNHHYIGPIIIGLDAPVPKEVLNLPKDRPIVYFAMGSTGNPEIVREIIEGFKDKPYRVIAPVRDLIAKRMVAVPENVLVTGLVPADKVNPLADLSVIHGGQGTVYTACLAGTPIVGVGMQPEQENNLECLVRKGFAIRIRKRRLTAGAVLDAIARLLHDAEAKKKAREFQKIVRTWDGPTNAAKFLWDNFGD